MLGFDKLISRIVNKRHVSNEEKFQDNAFNLAMQIKQTCTNAFETVNIKETTGECQGKRRSLYLFLLGETGITVTVQ